MGSNSFCHLALGVVLTGGALSSCLADPLGDLPSLRLNEGGPVGASAADCRDQADPAARLACYDRAFKVPQAAASPVSVPVLAQGVTDAPLPEKRLPSVKETPSRPSLLGQAWDLDSENRGKILRIRQYQPVYLLPLFHATRPNQNPSSPAAEHSVDDALGLDSNEAKLQISLKTKVMEDIFGNNGDLWFGYTQTSRWQVYNPGLSRPFRETDHEPEAMLMFRTDYDLGGWRGRLLGLSLNHQSNGRSLPLSRSWNRVMLNVGLEQGDWTVNIRPWWRIPEDKAQDDNPDISDYLGRGDLQLVRRWGKHQFSALLRHNLRSGDESRGAIQLDWGFPLAGELRGHLQVFNGYGESMIDYNHRATYYGVGVSLLEWY